MKPSQAQQPLPKPKPEQPPPTPPIPPPPIEWVLDPSGWILGKNRRTICMILPTAPMEIRTMIAEAPRTVRERDRLLFMLKRMTQFSDGGTGDATLVSEARALVEELTAAEAIDGNDS